MYRIETDVHTHTLISLHAYSTAEECARHAAQAGRRGFALTDHCSLEMAQRENKVCIRDSPFTNPFLRTLVKLLCIPLVMGLGYELILSLIHI